MQKVRVELGDRSYSICIGSGTLADIGQTLLRFEFSSRLALVSNPKVGGLYGKIVADSVRDAGFELIEIEVPDGEEFKSLTWAGNVYTELLKARLDRKSALLALGGGVIGDLTGFVAATYMRGVDFVQIPTTLLAQVDSSVGGKTGVNHPLGKNMIGAFWQPRLVWIDLKTLDTLEQRQLLAGLGEVIKYGVIWDEDLFEFLEVNRDLVLSLDEQALTYIVKRACEIKSEVVAKDERESGLRAILNYGHTVGHAIETVTEYRRMLHGEAVAVGMHVEAKLSHIAGMLDKKSAYRIKALLETYGFASEIPDDVGSADLMKAMELDKKAVAGSLRFILPEAIGQVKVTGDVQKKDIMKALSPDRRAR